MKGRPAITREIAAFALGDVAGSLDESWLHMATRAFVDTIAVAHAGATQTSARLVGKAVAQEAAGGCPTFLGTRASPMAAALVNASAAHALDLDDSIDEMKGHPSAVLVPAIFAASTPGTTGREMLEAYFVGLRTDIAVSAGVDIHTHFASGWHSTATIGIFGAVAAICRLRRVELTTARHALAIAASMAAGSLQNFGSMAKPLHAGLAASNAVLAVAFAEAGVTADPDQLEGPLGYFAMYARNPDLEAVQAALVAPSKAVTRGLNFKLYPSCSGTHWAAEAVLRIAAEVDPADVGSVEVTVEPRGLIPLMHHRPRTPSEARFSMEYAVAACLVDRGLGLASFTPEAVTRPEVQALFPRVHANEAEVPPLGPPSWDRHFAVVRVTTSLGQLREARVDVPRGQASQPLTDAELTAKARQCLTFAGFDAEIDDLLDRMWQLDTEGGDVIAAVVGVPSTRQHSAYSPHTGGRDTSRVVISATNLKEQS